MFWQFLEAVMAKIQEVTGSKGMETSPRVTKFPTLDSLSSFATELDDNVVKQEIRALNEEDVVEHLQSVARDLSMQIGSIERALMDRKEELRLQRLQSTSNLVDKTNKQEELSDLPTKDASNEIVASLDPPKAQPIADVSPQSKEYQHWKSRVYKEGGACLERAPDHVRGDKAFLLEAIKSHVLSLLHAPKEFHSDKDFITAAVQQNGHALQHAAPEFCNNKHVVLTAVRQNGRALKHASPNLQDEKEVVLAAVQQYGQALQHASPRLQNDKEVVRVAAVQGDRFGRAIQHASLDLRNDKELMLAVVQKSGNALEHASSVLRNDKDIVLAAVQNAPVFSKTIKYASPQLQEDKEFVEYAQWMAKVKKNGKNLEKAPDYIRDDKQIVLTAVQKTGSALKFASPALQNDKEVVIAAVQTDGIGVALQFASPHLQNNAEVVTAAVQKHGRVLKHASSSLHDKNVVLAALKQNPDAIKYAPEDMKRDRDVLVASGMFDEYHDNAITRQRRTNNNNNNSKVKKITLSTRFSLNRSSLSQATVFTKLLKDHEYIQEGNFIIYAPNAFDKKTCDPNWTDFDWPCRGTHDTCQYKNVFTTSADGGHNIPTDDCCWRCSFRHHLEESKDTQGFMLQLVERGDWNDFTTPPILGNGQEIERDMANSLNMKIFHVYRPRNDKLKTEGFFSEKDMEEVVTAIRNWYDQECQDMSECIVRPRSSSN